MVTGRVEIGGQNRGGYASVPTMGVNPPGLPTVEPLKGQLSALRLNIQRN